VTPLQKTPLDLISDTLFGEERQGGSTLARRVVGLFLAGLLQTTASLVFVKVVHLPHSGPFAVFLAAAGLSGRFDGLLDENRRAIYEQQIASRRANAATAAGVLSIFLGMFAAFGAAAMLSSELKLGDQFQFVLEGAELGDDTILSRSFGAAPGLFVHNALVLTVFFALAFVYQSYGALLALSWNACIWGLVLTFLLRRGMLQSHANPALFVGVTAVAVLPHLVLEAAGYVVGSLAAIYLSKAVTRYSPGEAVFREILRAVLALSGIALGCLLLGALVESTLPHLVLSLLGG
jgi:hypothetical protein